MVAAVVLATVFPDVGRSGGPLHGEWAADAGMALVFLLHGLGLRAERIRAGVSRWRLHAVVQTFTFGVFPLMAVALTVVARSWLPRSLALGFLYLGALPSTLSSSVAMTALAGGNVPGAIFNAMTSNLLGVIVTPLLVAVAIGSTGGAPSLAHAIGSIALVIVVPFGVGQALRPVASAWFHRHERHTHLVDRGVILLIVYVTFCDSVHGGLWKGQGPGLVAVTLAGAGLLLATVLALTRAVAAWLRFEREDEIAAVFCGSKKALAPAVAMAKVLFGAHAGLGLIVLPIMCYHQLQLFVCSLLAERYARAAPPR